jgi:hypothetical protein
MNSKSLTKKTLAASQTFREFRPAQFLPSYPLEPVILRKIPQRSIILIYAQSWMDAEFRRETRIFKRVQTRPALDP